MDRYLVATTKPWNIQAYIRHSPNLLGEWHIITTKQELTVEFVNNVKPRFIFFPHWSWIVPAEIRSLAECVCFHMTDVPYGRGGSPLQNLIQRGHKKTKISALRMEDELDAGPVYMKEDLSLEGSAQQIFGRAADIIYAMIDSIIKNRTEPTPQMGEVVHFERRTPSMSVLPKVGSVQDIYNHIRMLDAPTYPQAFLTYGEFLVRFSEAEVNDEGRISACVVIEKNQS